MASTDAARFVQVSSALDRMQFLYLAVCFLGGLFGLSRALRQVRTVTARRQLRWIAWGTAFGAGPFAFGYALPYALGVAPSIPMQLSAVPLSLIPLAYASAIVRYRLMDVEVIVKRALVYAAVLSAVVAMYVVLLKVVQRMFVAGQRRPRMGDRVSRHARRRAARAAGQGLRADRRSTARSTAIATTTGARWSALPAT